ncbi:MAG: efflux RND transporter periplasmic adaptor subunit [Deltaproteobacteria bacterium]|nr:efflux RND transporter periplasmic adaptor subunit [Deltaproteobacteria bacterium]
MKPARLFVIFLFLLFGCSKEKGPAQDQREAKPLGEVKAEVIQPMPVEDFFEAVGTVVSRRTVGLSSKAVGTVVSISAKEGDRVSKGKILVEIDSRDLQAELQGAEAALEEMEGAIKAAESGVVAAKGQRDLAHATFKRYESLIARGSVTPQEYDEVRAKYTVAEAETVRAEENLRALKAKREQAKAKLSYAKTLLSYTTIVSPFDAVVTAKIAEAGMLAVPGSPLLTVEEVGYYRLEVQVGESRIAQVRPGKTVPVSIDAIEKELSGNVAEVVPAADPKSRTFTVKIALPSDSLMRYQERVIRYRLVKTGKEHGDRIEILSGLNAGERVVVKGVERVSEGNRLPS